LLEQNIENLFNILSDVKVKKLISLIQQDGLKKDCDIFELKSKLSFLPNENNALKKVLDETTDPKIIPVLFNYKNQIRDLKTELDDKTTLVWTSPVIDLNADLTYNTMIQMIRSAEKKITIVGYALYKESKNDELKMSDIFKELYEKVESKNVLVELFFDKAETNVKNTVKKMWKKEIKLPEIYLYESPPKIHGSLHAKVLLIDDTDILITSANMTGRAINRNIEIGIKTSGNVGTQARELLISLIKAKLFEKQEWI
jgi:hypothetical protein